MATSTSATIRSALVAAIQGIAVSSLGFTSGDAASSTQELLLEDSEQDDAARAAAYLFSTIGGVKKVRKWAVQVTSTEEPHQARNIAKRTYYIKVRCYYSAPDIATMVAHREKVAQAIWALEFNLGGRVDSLAAASNRAEPQRARRELTGRFVFMDMDFVATKMNPDY